MEIFNIYAEWLPTEPKQILFGLPNFTISYDLSSLPWFHNIIASSANMITPCVCNTADARNHLFIRKIVLEARLLLKCCLWYYKGIWCLKRSTHIENEQ